MTRLNHNFIKLSSNYLLIRVIKETPTLSWLKKILKFHILKSSRMDQFYYFLSIIPSPWLKKIWRFDILKTSKMSQFYYFLSIIPSPWLRKFLSLKKIMVNQKNSDIFYNENFIWDTFCQERGQKETILAKSLLRRQKSP